MLFPTTVVGSLPRLEYVKDLQNLKPTNDFEHVAWESQINNAVKFIISMMNQTGIDIITDGEWRRKSYTDVFAQMASGFVEGEKIGKEFSIGSVKLKAHDLCRPCRYLQESLQQKNIVQELLHTAGLRCEILSSGKIYINDQIIS